MYCQVAIVLFVSQNMFKQIFEKIYHALLLLIRSISTNNRAATLRMLLCFLWGNAFVTGPLAGTEKTGYRMLKYVKYHISIVNADYKPHIIYIYRMLKYVNAGAP